ncbi:DUF4386 domain-containing protein [Adhaeribacter swui]|uniref:DUF4386 domain-containing protein n=1 Tax=Adhaeribacter swui TaxID=2086471 RepID=A0A7G7G4V8_9BACT|nr:DUF4386 domain-containing protein [Adhaeribacter swui]QNF32192.1 DUF4386 domain-containing protein [Adhaeribacter swui]
METIKTGKQKDKTAALITGVFYLAAALTAIVALKLYEPILYHPDYLVQGAKNTYLIVLGAFLELLTVATVAGTAIMLFPYLRKFNESMGLAYLCFRVLEAILILVGIVSVLSLLTLSQTFTKAVAPDVVNYQITGIILKAVHDYTFMLGPNFMLGINTFLYSLVFYSSRLIPKKLALMGLIGALLIFLASLLELFGLIRQVSVEGVLLALPVFAYEIILAVWLITKGFNQEVLSARSLQAKVWI